MSFYRLASFGLLGTVLVTIGSPRPGTLPVVQPNANTMRAGVLRDRVLTVTLDARESLWRIDGPNRPAMTVAAFAEAGKAPLMPGPLVRAPAGSELRLSVRNTLSAPLTLFVPASMHGGEESLAADDSVVIAPGTVGTLTTRAMTPGNYLYRATTPARVSQKASMAGVLAGALVIDSAGAPTQPHDRVFVIMGTPDSALAAFADTSASSLPLGQAPNGRGFAFTINGRSWPATERVHATVGDSLHWRIINASTEPHPMHLHGFYYRVDQYSTPSGARFGRPAPGQMVVTQLVSGFSTMSMTWSPDRPGQWLFHCHLAIHNAPHAAGPLHDPVRRDMAGLVLGVEVAARPGVVAAGEPAPTRRLRLIAEPGISNRRLDIDSVPLMHFVLEEHGRTSDAGPDFSPELDLVRGEPVAITIVNHIHEATSVHWHGIELDDSYMDGVPGFSGSGERLTPAIVPGDSFVARFTPPRSGTFMYHAHMDDAAEQLAGLEGALIVRDPGAVPSSDDHVLFLKGYNAEQAHPLEINGQANPDTLVLHVGRPARLRLINLSTVNVAPAASLTARPDSARTIARDTMLVRWRALAKDGFDEPPAEQRAHPARQIVAVGETYDFEYTPTSPGTLQLEIRTNGRDHQLLIRVPIRVE